MRYSKSSKSKGSTLIELLLSIGAASTMAVGTFVFYLTDSTTAAAHRAGIELVSLTAAVTGAYASVDYYAASTSAAVSEGWLPDSIGRDGNGYPVNPWGSAYTLTPVNGGSGFSVTEGAVPQEACTIIVPGLGALYTSVTINGAAVDPRGFPDQIASACNAQPTATIVVVSQRWS